MNRREFLGWTVKGGATAVALGLGLRPQGEAQAAPATIKTEKPKSGEIIVERDEPVIVEFEEGLQKVRWAVNPLTGEKCPKSCDEPRLKERGGFDVNEKGFDWKNFNLSEVEIDSERYPILSSVPLGNFRREEAIALHKNPNLVDEQIQTAETEADQENLTRIKCNVGLQRKKGDILVIYYDGIRTRQYQMIEGEQRCELVEDRSKAYDPKYLSRELVQDLRNGSGGVIDYRPIREITVTEETLPFTTDPSRAPVDLIEAYGKTVDNEVIREAARRAGVNKVFVFGPPSLGMYERDFYKDTFVFGLNYECPPENALHSICHWVEDLMLYYTPDKISDAFRLWSGRIEEQRPYYGGFLPYFESEEQTEAMKERGVVASAGIGGSVHLPPNATQHYQYDSPVKVKLPGEKEPIDSSVWGGTHEGYLKYWLGKMPKEFLKRVASF